MDAELEKCVERIESIDKRLEASFKKLDKIHDRVLWLSSWCNSELGFRPTAESPQTDGNTIRRIYDTIESSKQTIETALAVTNNTLNSHERTLKGPDDKFGLITTNKIMWRLHVPIWGGLIAFMVFLLKEIYKRLV